ncbi:hypothetical protein CALCODRAFT_483809 [Calocera cornea HHB12733]|uniref:DUF7053 domain-containing protein n=1 Tax=Calocera cornea HHB12733 TaxID=1353952 RepID=A0A165FFP2_9BASI|nr:hypothetical protein CALCODRAFT_483809 [Calocera cornea HHB12733]
MFERHTSVTTSRVLPFAPEQVLAIVQHPEQLIRLNPLVVGCRLLPPSEATVPSQSGVSPKGTLGEPAAGGPAALPGEEQPGEGAGEGEGKGETWEIDDRALLLWCIPFHIRYRATFFNTPDGSRVYPRAGAGVRLENLWVVRPCEGPAGGGHAAEGDGDGKGWSRVEERADIWAPLGLVGYVKGTLGKAHAELMDGLERRLGELGGELAD